MTASSLILIGMPASGKTTIGRRLAGRLGYAFIDTDRLLEQETGLTLPALMQQAGLVGFRQAEERTLLAVRADRAVIATGGSAVYSEPGMAALSRLGPRIFLHCPLEALAARVGDPAARGMLIAPGQSFDALFQERLPLYRRHADIEIATAGLGPEEVTDSILRRLPDGPG
ncbi:MAG: shikimate kinase [Ectothiorhodospiraceae bacterium]|nr:shikimate kinase [Ectothiorhodospiraceae bacterium]MCH8503610.1 shikimate kinase [Ectothiorhodospiraceae bacterium]